MIFIRFSCFKQLLNLYFNTWIIRILINKCYDIIKKNKKISYLNKEMEIDENLEMARLFLEEANPSALMAAKLLIPYERNYLQALLKVKRFANRLPKNRRFRLMGDLNKTVDTIDPTIYGFEEKLGEIEKGLA